LGFGGRALLGRGRRLSLIFERGSMKTGQRYIPRHIFAGIWIPSAILKLNIPPNAKLLFAALVNHSDGEGIVNPCQKTLANEIGASRQTVGMMLQILEEEALIKRQKPAQKLRWKHAADVYVFTWHEALNFAPPLTLPPCQKVLHGAMSKSLTWGARKEKKEAKKRKEYYMPAPAKPGVADHPRWRKLATQLCNAIQKRHKVNYTSNVSIWAKQIRLLHTKDKATIPDITKAMSWYCTHYPKAEGDEFFLVIESGAAFRKKFVRLQMAMKRHKQDQHTESDPDITAIVEKTTRSKTNRVLEHMDKRVKVENHWK